MNPHLVFRTHSDLHTGLGQVVRALAVQESWKALGGQFTLAISGDEHARKVGTGLHPFTEQSLPFPVIDLGERGDAPLPSSLASSAQVVLVDQWDVTPDLVDPMRPLKVAIMEDDGDAHEQADLLFQPYLEGVSWPSAPLKVVDGRKVRPCETWHGRCRVLRGSAFAVVSPVAIQKRPKREPLQPLAVHKLLVSFGGTDGAGLASRAYDVLAALVREKRWTGACTLLAPGGLDVAPFAGCQVLEVLPNFSQRMQDFDAVWCAAGVTLAEALCLGVPAAVWAQNERQERIIGDFALANGCYNLGLGPEADLQSTQDALEHWLGPEGQETRQEQTRDGMSLFDGSGASRVAQELWSLAHA